jgi:putative nucleotidyltransferase with HDIG domain
MTAPRRPPNRPGQGHQLQSETPSADRSIAELERRLDELPLLPSIVGELLWLDPNSEEYFDRLLHLAERDPPFAVRVLRAANSAASAPTVPIMSLQGAVMRLGTQRCAELVLALAVIKVFVPRTEAQRFLWLHSLQTALLARMFCQRVGAVHCNADQAYLCGLLHDIGRFVQFEGAPADLLRVNDLNWSSPEELVDAEKRSVGYDHTLLGWHACRKWSLPPAIGEVVRRHHEILGDSSSGADDLIRVVQWADHLSMALIMDKGFACTASGAMIERLRQQHPEIGPRSAPGDPHAWHACVPDVYAESLRLAALLKLS